MIKCLLFGHKPDEMFEYQRVGNRRLTHCERCGQGVTEIVAVGRPLSANLTKEYERTKEANREAARVVGYVVADRMSDEIEALINLAITAKGPAKVAPVRRAVGKARAKRS